MKRRMTLSIALVLSVALLSLMGSVSTANAAPLQESFADTGLITLGPNQILRLTVACAARRSVTLKVSTIIQAPRTCTGGLCRHTIASLTTTNPMTLAPGESASVDIVQPPNSSGVRGGITVSSPDVEINALIIDINTGEVRSNKLFVGGLSWDTNDEGLR